MGKIGLFFATDTGNTRKIAKLIKKKHFDDGVVDICNFEKATPEMVSEYSALIIGTPTLGEGEYPEALEGFLPSLADIDFSGKTIALFGLGDQQEYAHEFVDALGMFYEEIEDSGATFVGFWSTDGYEYTASKADMGDGKFCGLVLDQDNQSSMSDDRLAAWIADVKPALLAAAGAESAVA
jgi:flavodoxin I